MSTIPASCQGVKCMIKDCKNLSSHKIGEENVFCKDTQKTEYDDFNRWHNLTTYLCDEHFEFVMTREERYFKNDDRFNVEEDEKTN